jgi:CBS domain-containing protein
MSRHPVAVHEGDDLSEAVELLTSTKVKSVPVLDAARHVVGMLSRRDVVHLLARDDDRIEREVDELYRQAGVDWLVSVQDGLVTVEGPVDPTSRAMATSLAVTVPGVTGVRVEVGSDTPPSRESGSR